MVQEALILWRRLGVASGGVVDSALLVIRIDVVGVPTTSMAREVSVRDAVRGVVTSKWRRIRVAARRM